MHQFTSKECNLINLQHKEYNFSSGNRADLNIFLFFKCHFIWSLNIIQNIQLFVKLLRGLSEAFESTLTILIYSTLKLFSNVT